MEIGTIGNRIKLKRMENGLTQNQLHNMTGLSVGNISELELNKKYPSVKSLIKLSEALCCSTDWLIKGSDPDDESFSSFSLCAPEEYEMLQGFRQLGPAEREEMLGILSLKLQKIKKETSSAFVQNNKSENSELEKMA